MKSSDHNHESLLSELFEGPNVEAVVATIRREKAAAQRYRRFAAGAAITVFAVSACFFSLRERPREEQPLAHVPAAKKEVPIESPGTSNTAAFPVERIDDEQLIALLEGHPAALVHLPSGQQQLLMVTNGDRDGVIAVSSP